VLTIFKEGEVMKKARQRIIIIVSLLAIVVMLTLATRYPPVEWRISVLKLKLSGELPPNLTWKKIYSGITTDSPIIFTKYALKTMVDGSAIYRGFELESNGLCSTLWDTPLGSFWSSCNSYWLVSSLINEQIKGKIYDHDSARVKQGDVVIDVGGHIGTFTRFALKRGAHLVIAFEPDPINIFHFKKNFEKEISTKKVILIEAAAWDSPGNLKFKNQGIVNTGARRVDKNGNIVVPAVTIDDTTKRLELDRVDFIKMDIEGAERNAVAGASKTISRFKPKMALCTYHLPDDPEVISSLVFNAYPDYKIVQAKKIAYFFDEKRVSSTKK
jgi:FkbM family methyltransferase